MFKSKPKYFATVPPGNEGSIPVTANGKSGFVKVPFGLRPGATFFYREKDIFQKPEVLHTVNCMDKFAPAPPPAVSSPAPMFGEQPCFETYGQVGIAPVGYYPEDQIYNANSAATSPLAITYEHDSTKEGFITKSQLQPKAATYRVNVPIDARPGQTFHCIINGERIGIVVPPGAVYGTILTLQGPAPVKPSAPPIVPAEYADIPVATVIYCDGVYYNGYTGPEPSAPTPSPQRAGWCCC